MTDQQLLGSEEVVDLDIRVADTAQSLAPYADQPWRVALDEPGPNPPWSLRGIAHPYLGGPPSPGTPAASPAQALDHLDETGAGRALLNPSALLDLAALPTVEYASACARAYNRWLVDRWLGSDRLWAAALVAPQDPVEAAEELDRTVTAGAGRIAAVVVPLTGLDPLLGHRRYDVLFDAACSHRLPLILHAGGQLMMPGSPYLRTGFSNQFEQLAMSRPLLAMAHLVSMAGTGVFPRYPDLRVVFLGAGASWLVHCVLRMDKEYNENRRDVPYYRQRVSSSITSQVLVGTQPWLVTRAVDVPAELRASFGLRSVLFASGWGGAEPDTLESVRDALLDSRERTAVLGGNARDLLRPDRNSPI